MNTTQLETVWAPRVLGLLRIIAALIFMAHGTQKLLGFPAPPQSGRHPCCRYLASAERWSWSAGS